MTKATLGTSAVYRDYCLGGRPPNATPTALEATGTDVNRLRLWQAAASPILARLRCARPAEPNLLFYFPKKKKEKENIFPVNNPLIELTSMLAMACFLKRNVLPLLCNFWRCRRGCMCVDDSLASHVDGVVSVVGDRPSVSDEREQHYSSEPPHHWRLAAFNPTGWFPKSNNDYKDENI